MGLISTVIFLIAGVRSDLNQSFAALAVPLIFCGVAAGDAVVLALRGPHKAPIPKSNWILAGAPPPASGPSAPETPKYHARQNRTDASVSTQRHASSCPAGYPETDARAPLDPGPPALMPQR